jgi:hypothetical protein
MTIFSILKQEHAQASPLDAFTLLKQELLAHAEAEKKSLYDRLIDEPATHQVVMQSIHGHDQMISILREIEATPTSDASWFQKLAALRYYHDIHVQETEGVIFQRGKAILHKHEQKDIADDFRDRKFSFMQAFA